MNLNIHLPSGCAERIITALERIAEAAERIAGPVVTPVKVEPYDRSLWGYTDNATSRQVEQEEQREAEGFGPDYERALEHAAFGPPDQLGDDAKG